MQQEEWLEVGRVVAPQGIRGEVRVTIATDFAERLSRPGLRLLRLPDGTEQKYRLLGGRALTGKNLYVCRFEGIDDRDGAQALAGATVFVAAAERPALAPGEFWLPDLMGLTAIREDTGEKIGSIQDLRRAGNDLLVIRKEDGREVLVPFVEALVPTVDLEGGRVVIVPIPGLLDLNEAEADTDR